MADLETITADQFESHILKATTPVLVDFTAVWCGPCKMLEPILKELADRWADQVRILKVDVDQNPELAMQYNVMGVPTLMLFLGGKVVERLSGYQPKERLLKTLEPYLSAE
ncbi:MAG: thioredoxin [Anaerolineae bacterium]|jgi:thioredoxin 1|nr:MAG: thioredoxin [Anaerolineae bacterium]